MVSGRSSDVCVIIPVINEGSRIQRLLARMADLGIQTIADILVVDGGSKDGSLDQVRASPARVRGIVHKIGPGRLSAQLRAGYAFAVTEGYEYVVTIDGNNKDDPEAIAEFVKQLRAGYDFVQASRFIKGGVAENTPILRWIAIRLIHAPLVSLASGFRWTDTTQGFRGYSRALLTDSRLQIFRECFGAYELLVYLSCRAPRVGFRCIEIPTARRYPSTEVPTKISPIRGSLNLMRTLLGACLGRYNP